MYMENSLRNTIKVSKSLDSDQVQHFISPDVGLNCLLMAPGKELIVMSTYHTNTCIRECIVS